MSEVTKKREKVKPDVAPWGDTSYIQNHYFYFPNCFLQLTIVINQLYFFGVYYLGMCGTFNDNVIIFPAFEFGNRC